MPRRPPPYPPPDSLSPQQRLRLLLLLIVLLFAGLICVGLIAYDVQQHLVAQSVPQQPLPPYGQPLPPNRTPQQPRAMGKKLVTQILRTLATYDDTFARKVLDSHFAADKDRNFVWPEEPYEPF